MRRALAALAAVALSFALSACVQQSPAPQSSASDPAPVGPVPAPSGPLTLERVTAIVSEQDAPDTLTFTAGTDLSTSGDDLASENDYWAGNGGTPERCAGVVSAPYLVSAHDTGARLDDPSYLVGTFTEIDEDRFGLIQVYARQFDDAATASAFLSEFVATVSGCRGYQLKDGDTVTVNAVSLTATTLSGLPDGVDGVHYVEKLSGSASNGVTIDFLQRDAVVISVYGELTPSSTIAQADVDAISAEVAERMRVL